MKEFLMSRSNKLRALGDIADIRTGYAFRGKIEEVGGDKANIHVAQIKDARKLWQDTQSAAIAANQLPMIRWDGRASSFVEPGSVLLPSRGGYFRASYLISSEASTLPVVASSQFLIIKPSSAVLPEFLCWSLNQPRTQHHLDEASQGTNIPMLSATMVKQLKLPIPTVETQTKVLRLNQIWEQEQKLTHALLKNREAQLQGVFQQLMTDKIK